MSGRSSRDKGKRGEYEVRDLFNAAGFTCRRTPNSGGLHIPGDIVFDTPCGVHVEIKRHERISMPAWIAQAEADCPEGVVPIVAWRTSRMPWRADVPLEWLISLLASRVRDS